MWVNKRLAAWLYAACMVSSTSIFASPQIKNIGNDMISLEKTKSYCIGRYVVDLPAEAQALDRYDQYDSFMIKAKLNATRHDFEVAVKKWRNDYSKGNRKVFEDPAVQIYDHRITKIFKGKLADKKILPYDVFALVLDQHTLFFIEGNHSDLPKWSDESHEAIQHLVKSLRARAENEIPKENGQCIGQGFIKDDDHKFRHSKQKMGFDFKHYPSVVLRFESETNSRPVAQLIPRLERKLIGVGQSQSQINKDNIRKGEKNLTQLNGQEWISVEKMKGKNGISALWEHTGTTQNNKDPLIGFELNTGYASSYADSSNMEQFEAIKLYESILKTIRKF